ncbi:Metalloendopeptidase [Aphelenchoides bicaudatus]|nr:Metalloendopeptidase [Aphelenchoides bicaudatus]
MFLASTTLFVLVLGFASALPPHMRMLEENNEDFIYGDIKLTEEQKLMRQLPENAHSKIFIFEHANRWENNIMPVAYSSKITAANREKIRKGLKVIERQTCFRFPDRKSEKDYVEFTLDTTPNAPCWSLLGRIGNGKQPISYVQGCIDDTEGTLVHEVLHALGVGHEHQRPDRDSYVFIDSSLASSDQYEKTSSNLDTKHFPYDTKSVMHYPGFQTKNKQGKLVNVLYDKKTNRPVPRNMKMSAEDVRKLNEFGKCSGGGNAGRKPDAKRPSKRVPKKPAKKQRRQPNNNRRPASG